MTKNVKDFIKQLDRYVCGGRVAVIIELRHSSAGQNLDCHNLALT